MAAFEILIANHPVRNIIREGKTQPTPQPHHDQPGRGHVHPGGQPGRPDSGRTWSTYDEAMAITSHPKELERLLSQRGAMLSTA